MVHKKQEQVLLGLFHQAHWAHEAAAEAFLGGSSDKPCNFQGHSPGVSHHLPRCRLQTDQAKCPADHAAPYGPYRQCDGLHHLGIHRQRRLKQRLTAKALLGSTWQRGNGRERACKAPAED
eukprot:scaffold1019_cov255-Pinguiococcus_pyrenoidosus.AAC.2